MASTFTPIQSYTLTGTQSSVTFNTGLSGYTDLYLVINAKNTTNGSACKYQLNGDTNSNYSTNWIEGTSSATSGRALNDTSAFLYYNGGANTNNWSQVSAHFQNYSNASTYKSCLARFGNQAQTGSYASLWRGSGTPAITSITLLAITQNFQIDSTFTLYGIKAA